MIVILVLIMLLLSELILVYTMDINERKIDEMEGTVKISLDDYNQLLEERSQLYAIRKLVEEDTNRQIDVNKSHAAKTEYLNRIACIDAKDICDITGWAFDFNFKNELVKAEKVRDRLIKSKMHNPESIEQGN